VFREVPTYGRPEQSSVVSNAGSVGACQICDPQ